MSVAAFLATAFLETLAPGSEMLACTFPAPSPREAPISVSVEARPSLMDRIDQFRVRLHLGGDREVAGLVQPIERTGARDVLIRARAPDATLFTIGLREDGLAALNLLRLRPDADVETAETRPGACRDAGSAVDAWLRS